MAKAALQYDNVDSDDEIVQGYYTRNKPEVRHTSTGNADPSTYSHVWDLPLPEPAVGDEVSSPAVDCPGLSGVVTGDDKLEMTSQLSARSDQARYYVLDRGTNHLAGGGGANCPIVGPTRC